MNIKPDGLIRIFDCSSRSINAAYQTIIARTPHDIINISYTCDTQAMKNIRNTISSSTDIRKDLQSLFL